MTPTQHLASILRFWTKFGRRKYLKGQQEHGGQLRYKCGMLAHCEEETWDLCAYLPTLRAQLKDARMLVAAGILQAGGGEDHIPAAFRAVELLDEILGPPVNHHFKGEG